MKTFFYKKTHRGFTVLYAVLISGLLLSIGIGVYTVSVKEFQLSALSNNSQVAIFAADTGLECALYWDVTNPTGFAENTPDDISPLGATCLGSALVVNRDSGANAFGATTTFQLLFPEGYCASVAVRKDIVGGTVNTVINSYGYNTACTGTNIRRVERALRVRY